MPGSVLEIPKSDAGEQGIAIRKRYITSRYPTHLHSVFELEYILDGEAVTYIDSTPYPLKKGALKLCTPLDVETLEVASSVTLLNINFTEAFVSSELLPDITTGFAVQDVDDRLITLLRDEYHNNKPYSTLYQKSLLNLILLDIIRRKNQYLPQSDSKKSNSIAQQVALFIHLHYREQLTLKDISSHFSYTHNHLSKLFQNTFNMSITQYLCKTRLEQAEKLLLCSDLTVTEISNEAGFPSISTFFRVFKQQRGISPKEFQRGANAENNETEEH